MDLISTGISTRRRTSHNTGPSSLPTENEDSIILGYLEEQEDINQMKEVTPCNAMASCGAEHVELMLQE